MTSKFNNPAFVFSADGTTATLHEPMTYAHPLKTIKVPKGFTTDFASIPRFFQRIIPKLDRHILAAVLHDWLYFSALVPKPEADAIFLDAMQELGVPTWKRYAMYFAVRLGGGAAWNDHRKAGHKA